MTLPLVHPDQSDGRSEPYDDSFALGPVPGGDILYSPPQHVGEDPTPTPTASSTSPSPAHPPPPLPPPPPHPSGWPYGNPGEEQVVYHPPPPPTSRPTAWGPSQVNIPSSGGPPPTRQRPPWAPSRGHRKRLPTWILVFGGLWLFSQLFGFARHALSSLTDDGSPSVSNQMIDGMSLVANPVVTTRDEIVWRFENPPQDMRTYTLWHDGVLVRTFTATGTFRTAEPYEPGRWEITFPNLGQVRCGVFIDAERIATMTNPASPDASCSLDTTWIDALPK